MMPENTLSSTPMPDDWRYPNPNAYNPFIAYEWGGVALEDITQGLDSHLWKLEYDTETFDVKLNRVDQDATVLFNREGIVRLGLAFDQNMHLTYCYEIVLTQEVELYFYNTAIAAQDTLTLTGITSPCITLDDKRVDASDTSDIIFAYIRDGNIYYRQQRDRFTIERVLGSVNPTEIITRIGMSQGGRLLIELRGIEP